MIKTDNFYFGFTDNIKEPRKTKVENLFDKLIRYDGKVYNVVEYLCLKLLEGYYLGKEENYTYYKRNGELTKPKTLYKFVNKSGNTYIELKKTEYDFVEYLINNGLDTEQAMEKAIADHKVYMEEQKRLQEENERVALKKAEQKEKDIQEVYIAFHNKDHSEWRKVIAECFTKYGINFFILRDNDEWKISVKRVGLLIAKGKTRSEAMENLKVNIDKMENVEQMIENARKTIEKSAGVNPLYKEVC